MRKPLMNPVGEAFVSPANETVFLKNKLSDNSGLTYSSSLRCNEIVAI